MSVWIYLTMVNLILTMIDGVVRSNGGRRFSWWDIERILTVECVNMHVSLSLYSKWASLSAKKYCTTLCWSVTKREREKREEIKKKKEWKKKKKNGNDKLKTTVGLMTPGFGENYENAMPRSLDKTERTLVTNQLGRVLHSRFLKEKINFKFC